MKALVLGQERAPFTLSPPCTPLPSNTCRHPAESDASGDNPLLERTTVDGLQHSSHTRPYASPGPQRNSNSPVSILHNPVHQVVIHQLAGTHVGGRATHPSPSCSPRSSNPNPPVSFLHNPVHQMMVHQLERPNAGGRTTHPFPSGSTRSKKPQPTCTHPSQSCSSNDSPSA